MSTFSLALDSFTLSSAEGVAVPIPTLPPEIKIGEFVMVDAPLNTGTVPDDPLPVTVCAIAPAVNTTIVTPIVIIRFCMTRISFAYPHVSND
jgi:hypothetical protein